MFRTIRTPFILTTAIILSVSFSQMPANAAAITYVAQERFVRVQANVAGEFFSERIDAPDFQTFDVELDRTFANAIGFASGFASQTSQLGDDRMTASGSASGTEGPPAGTSGGGGTVSFEVTFQIETQTEYDLRLNLFSEFGSYSLTGPSLNHVNLTAGSFQSISIVETGTLLPGDYSFQVEIATGAAGQGLTGTFDLDFVVVPEPTSSLFLCGSGASVCLLRRRRPRR